MKEIIFLFVPLLFFAYALVIKGYLLHSRYALLIFPLMIISTCVFIYDIVKLFKRQYQKIGFLLAIAVIIGGTAYFNRGKIHFQFLPTNVYYFDYTSPQPDFKSAYAAIPNNSNVISGFPTLCDWYYADRGNCVYAIRVDLILDGKTTITTKESEKYTKIKYINNMNELEPGVYYFVVDNLTFKSQYINGELYEQIFGFGNAVYWSGEDHNSIVVMKVQVE